MRTITVALLFAVITSGVASAAGVDAIYTGFLSDSAIDGYDAVAYFTDGKPVKGSAEHTFEWKGATWRFATAEHKAQFEQEPDRYAPQYGGYCAYAVANGATAPGDPSVWRIVDGELYLNLSKSIQSEWEKHIPGFVRSADANWPRLLKGE
jgi:YHS domain-containing protein